MHCVQFAPSAYAVSSMSFNDGRTTIDSSLMAELLPHPVWGGLQHGGQPSGSRKTRKKSTLEKCLYAHALFTHAAGMLCSTLLLPPNPNSHHHIQPPRGCVHNVHRTSWPS